ncbi:MAG: hypothetical protein AAFR21_00280 [Pseudomonadota bacterium]
MLSSKLTWTGIVCCLSALLINLSPGLSTKVGIDVEAIQPVFVFGVFLILAGLALAAILPNGSRSSFPKD